MSEYSAAELETMLTEARAREAHMPYPKWVVPHESHLVQQGDSFVAPGLGEVHVDRDKVITVLVKDEDEEAKALAAAPEPVAEEPAQELDPDGNPATGGNPQPIDTASES